MRSNSARTGILTSPAIHCRRMQAQETVYTVSSMKAKAKLSSPSSETSEACSSKNRKSKQEVKVRNKDLVGPRQASLSKSTARPKKNAQLKTNLSKSKETKEMSVLKK